MSDNTVGNLLTSENSAEFYAQKLGLAPTESNNEATEEVEPLTEEVDGSEPKAEEEAKPQDEPKKVNPKLEKRFSEITRQREEVKRQLEQERQIRLELEQRLQNLERQPQQLVVDQNEPRIEQFQDYAEYAKAISQYTTDKRLNERFQQEEQVKAQIENQRVAESWASKIERFKEELPDFEEVVASSADLPLLPDVREVLLESDVGPKIVYYLAENADFARKIASMPVKFALKEIGKLEARFEAKADDKPVARSKAPAPVTPLRATTGIAETKLDSSGTWYGTFAEYKQARKSGKVR